jgi:tRNA threonylcarbamoyladenosine biosynthesis protein TsaB
LELSTENGSLAVLEGERTLMEREWAREQRQRQEVFVAIEALAENGSLDVTRVEMVAVGVGPGAFSGLRAALALAQALAMPGRTAVFGVTSAEALAYDVMRECGREAAVVCGDARRNELWAAKFRSVNGLPRQEGSWVVAGAEGLMNALGNAEGVWVTADWNRIGSVLERLCPAQGLLIGERRWPRAATVGRLAHEKRRAGLPSAPLAPVYLRPPVDMAFGLERKDLMA